MEEEQTNTTFTTTTQQGKIWPCGCSMKIPHSHLVAGHTCPCEQGSEDTPLSIKRIENK